MLESVIKFDVVQYFVYENSGYNPRAYLEIPFQVSSANMYQSDFIQEMYGSRITVEWIFMEFNAYWSMVDFPRKMRLLQLPVGSLHTTTVLISNVRN